MEFNRLTGLIAATYTPMRRDGELRLDQVAPMVEYLLESGVSGLYVCGSTGEGMSLTSDERRSVTEAFVKAANGRVPVIVQVGHNSLGDAKDLAEHAQSVGADVISATCPSYYKVTDVTTLVDCMADLAGGAPNLPFYYYHIPALTGSTIDMSEFLSRGSEKIANLVGLKYTDTKLFEFQHCLELDGGRFDVVWGCDEMLLGALATGARGAIGSTYNIAAPIYRKIINAFAENDIDQARKWQSRSVEIIRSIGRYPFHPAMKWILEARGFAVGGCRLPQGRLIDADVKSLQNDLQMIGFDIQSGYVVSDD